jgi:hypothetical protein
VTDPTPDGAPLSGLTGVNARAPERVPTRTRGSNFTQGAWRLPITSDQGAGAIVLVEVPEAQHYRGEGLFLGWDQERLQAVYRACRPEKDEALETPQLG